MPKVSTPTTADASAAELTAESAENGWANLESFTVECGLFDRLELHKNHSSEVTALVDSTARLSYGELWDRISAQAVLLQTRGIRKGQRVGIHCDRSVDTVTAVLAVLRLGAAYVPLDKKLPESRLAFVLEDAAISAVIVDGATPPWMANTETVQIGDLVRVEHSPLVGTPYPEADELAYVIYTSGSTGKPKGVPITHGNLGSLMVAWDEVMGTQRHVSLLLSALSFDASVCELFWPIHSGGTLVVVEESSGPSGFALPLGQLLRDHSVTHVQCTPTRATLLLADPDDRAAFGAVHHLVIGGEALTRQLATELMNLGIRRITNAYGPTEATVWACTYEVTRSVDTAIVPVGSPLRGVDVQVIDAEGTVVPAGVQGELVIGGPFVSRGYLNREELTRDRFGSRTFSSRDCWSYKTGDLASVRVADGMLDFHGRVDHQVKIRGHRIELGEIEAALDSLSVVQQSVVCVHPTRPNELVAFFTSLHEDVDTASLQIALGTALPAIMVPSRFVRLESFPMTTSNKVDRVLLAGSLVEQVESASKELAGPVGIDPLTEMVRDFAIVLGRMDIHPDTDFFGGGGHSLLAVELMSRISTRTGSALGIRALLEAPTPRALTDLVAAESGRSASASATLVHFPGAESATRKLYMVHGAAGNVLRFRDLAMDLTNDASIVAIQAFGAEGTDAPDQTLEKMVSRYVDAIRADSDGPYELGGYSSGGTIALHIANRLAQGGARIRSLVLLDSVDSTVHPSSRIEQFRTLIHNSTDRPNLSLIEWARNSAIGWRRRADWDREGFELTQRLGFVDLFDHIAGLVESAPPPGRVDAPALLVRSSVENPLNRRVYDVAYNTPSSVLTRWVGEKHDELLRPHTIPEIAAHVRGFLRVS